jgi:hypothetical protein
VVEFAVGIHLRDLYFLSAFEGDDVALFVTAYGIDRLVLRGRCRRGLVASELSQNLDPMNAVPFKITPRDTEILEILWWAFCVALSLYQCPEQCPVTDY